MFARYAHPPNELGYCGPDEPGALLDVAAAGRDLGSLARAFDGAWVYLEIIAAAAGIADPLDPRVVEAYWIGNELLERVDPRVFASIVRTAFAAEVGAQWGALDLAAPPPSVPHHGFQVFTVYPWVGLLGRGDPPLTVLDRCRIRWGQVVTIDGDQLHARCRPLTWDGHALGLGAERIETARWAHDGRSLLGQPAVGDHISLHWDWACERLGPPALHQLQARTAHQLDITNRALAGDPAAARRAAS